MLTLSICRPYGYADGKNHSKEGAEPLLWVGPFGRGFGGRAELQAAAGPLAPSRGRTNFKQRLTAEKKPLITPPDADDDGWSRFANGSFDG